MKASLTRLVLACFALCALVSMTNVACSSPTDVDSGTSELNGGGAYGVSYGGYGTGTAYGGVTYGYGFGVNLATDSAP